ncbi:lysine-rich nucleolar protein 1 [Pelobates fuscus]|uniref:lysine-rich nucleolar protein 1 n=1 Tax=Pelobates fuscus TaxID=191477 RepID=UPI002FE46D27
MAKGNPVATKKRKKNIVTEEPDDCLPVQIVPKKKKKIPDDGSVTHEAESSQKGKKNIVTEVKQPQAKNKKKKNVAEEIIDKNEILTKNKKKKPVAENIDVSSPVSESNRIVPPKKNKTKMVVEEHVVPSLESKTNKICPKKKKKENKIMEEEQIIPPLVTIENESIVKKKKRKIISEEIVVLPETSDIVPKKKKKKITSKERAVSPLVLETNEIVTKKKKKKKTSEECAVSSLVLETNEIVTKKKKKKMMSDECAVSSLVPETNEIVTKKKKKKILAEEANRSSLEAKHVAMKKTDALNDPEQGATEMKSTSKMTDNNVLKKKKKLKKDSKSNQDNDLITSEVAVNMPGLKKKNISGGIELSEVPVIQPNTDMSGSTKKKKRKTKGNSLLTEDIVAIDECVNVAHATDNVLCHEDNHVSVSGTFSTALTQVTDDSEPRKRSQKRKRKHSISRDLESLEKNKEVEADCDPTGLCMDDENLNDVRAPSEMSSFEKKKRLKEKKKVESQSGHDDPPNAKSDNEEDKDTKKKKKKKDKPKKREINEQETHDNLKEKVQIGENGKRPARATKQEETNQDVVLVSVKEGNCDEIEIDTARRKALQEEIDRESGNTKAAKLGQWNTASFQSSDQQAKFLRLMGAFKKGNQVAFTPPSNSEKANMALGKEEEKVLERNLEAEFDKALSWKRNSGIGLGFQPVQNKKFYIDKSASRSVKFE